MSKTLQQLDKEFKVRREILKEIEETSFSGMYAGDVVKEVIKWQSQLKNLSKEEKELTKTEQLASEIYYAQAKEVDISVDDWIEKLKNLSKEEKPVAGEELKKGDMVYLKEGKYFKCEEKPEKIEKLEFSEEEQILCVAEKVNEIIERLNNL